MAKFDFNEGAPTKKSSPTGWIFAGLVTVAGAGFAGAFYVPLSSAHQLLMSKHEELAKKSQELALAVKSSGADLKSSSSQLSAMQKVFEEAKSEQSAYESQVKDLSLATKKAYDKLTAARQVTFEATSEGARASTKAALLFRPKSAATLPFAGKFACSVSSALGANTKATVSVQVAPDAAAKDGFATAAQQAGAITDVLRSTCKIAPERLDVSLSGAKAGSVTLEVSAGDAPRSLKD